MKLPIAASITNPSPTVVVIASVLLLFGIVSFLPDSDEIYNAYGLDDEDNNNNNRRRNTNNNTNNNSNNNNNISNNNKTNYNINNNNNIKKYNNNNNSINNKETFFNRFKKMFSFLSKNKDNSSEGNGELFKNIEDAYDSFEDYSTTSSISSSTSSMYINNNSNNSNNNNNNNNNNNFNSNFNNNNNNYNHNQELIDQINAERNGRLIAEKKIEEKEMLLHSLQNEMAQREEFEKKLLQLCTIEIKKKKQYQDSLNELSEQISYILDTISNQSLIVNNNSSKNEGDNNNFDNYIDENDINNNSDDINNKSDKILVSIDTNLLQQFENISNIIKSLQHNSNINGNNSDSEQDNSIHDHHNKNYQQQQQQQFTDNSLPKEEALYLELVKISKQKIPFNFSDIISN